MSNHIERAAARERLYRAEDRFDDLTQGGRDLVDMNGTTYVFADGQTVKGVTAAADYAEQVVRRTAAEIDRNTP